MDRRNFLRNSSKTIAGTLLGSTLLSLKNAEGAIPTANLSKAKTDDEFWKAVSTQYAQRKDILNLYNGMGLPLLATSREENRLSEGFVKDWGDGYKETLKQSETSHSLLATLTGAEKTELAFCRSATDGFHLILSGLDLDHRDEVIYSNYEYPSLIEKIKAKSRKTGLKSRQFELELPLPDDKKILSAIEKAIGANTKLLVLSHIEYITGEILPVKEICKLCHSKNVKVFVDGAHSFAQLDFKIPDLECDYFSGSMHKWLSGPMGTGFLYVNKDDLKDVEPFYITEEEKSSSASKLQYTHDYTDIKAAASKPALELQLKIGSARKQSRLKQLRDLLVVEILKNPDVKIYTNLKQERSCAFLTFEIKSKKSMDISRSLWKNKVDTNVVELNKKSLIRIAPNLFQLPVDLKKFSNLFKDTY